MLVVLVIPLYIEILRKECNRDFLVIIILFTTTFSDICLFVGDKRPETENKINFLELLRSTCLVFDSTAAS